MIELLLVKILAHSNNLVTVGILILLGLALRLTLQMFGRDTVVPSKGDSLMLEKFLNTDD